MGRRHDHKCFSSADCDESENEEECDADGAPPASARSSLIVDGRTPGSLMKAPDCQNQTASRGFIMPNLFALPSPPAFLQQYAQPNNLQYAALQQDHRCHVPQTEPVAHMSMPGSPPFSTGVPGTFPQEIANHVGFS